MIVPHDLVGPLDAAILLGVSSASIRRWVHDGKMPGFKVGGRLRVSKADALAMLQRVAAPGPRLQTRAEVMERERITDETLRRAGIRK